MINTAAHALQTSYKVVRDYNPVVYPVTLWLLPIASHFCAPLNGDSTPKYWTKLVAGTIVFSSLFCLSIFEFDAKILSVIFGLILIPKIVVGIALAFFFFTYIVEGHSLLECSKRFGWYGVANNYLIAVHLHEAIFLRSKQHPMETKLYLRIFNERRIEHMRMGFAELSVGSWEIEGWKYPTYCIENRLFDVLDYMVAQKPNLQDIVIRFCSRPEHLRQLVARGWDINRICRFRVGRLRLARTVFEHACFNHNLNAAKALINLGARIDVVDLGQLLPAQRDELIGYIRARQFVRRQARHALRENQAEAEARAVAAQFFWTIEVLVWGTGISRPAPES